MTLVIHNTLTNKKEEFTPIDPHKRKVKMYVCGVTVYDDIHMGHARSMIAFDTVARYLRYKGYEVTHVTNFTDVDDKIIIKAAQEGIDPLDLSKRYIDEYFKDIKKLGVKRADYYPKASECIDDIIEMVQMIIDNGYGYVTPDGSVYFSVNKVKNYGRLTNHKLEDLESSGRINSDEQKQDAKDFAVWKAAKPGEIAWDSPWGKGRPGWHIECSAMIRRYLGDSIDIHGGGNDLIFPHHENEILQTEAAINKKLSKFWMHNGMLQVKGIGMTKEEKMSKSLGNFFRVKDVAKVYDRQTIRFFFLNTHYMSPLIYSEDGFIEAANSLKRLDNSYQMLRLYIKNQKEKEKKYNNKYRVNDESSVKSFIDATTTRFNENMDDDFNTPGAIVTLFDTIRSINLMIDNEDLSSSDARKLLIMLNKFDDVLGILHRNVKNINDVDAVMQILIDVRAELRKRKAYDLADMVRNRLTEAGIQLEDSAEGVKWKKI